MWTVGPISLSCESRLVKFSNMCQTQEHVENQLWIKAIYTCPEFGLFSFSVNCYTGLAIKNNGYVIKTQIKHHENVMKQSL